MLVGSTNLPLYGQVGPILLIVKMLSDLNLSQMLGQVIIFLLAQIGPTLLLVKI